MRRQPDIRDLDEARLMPRWRDLAERDAQQAAVLRRAIDEARDEPVLLPGVFKPEAGDLRGIPAIGLGVGGVQPGTQPERETIRRLTRREAA